MSDATNTTSTKSTTSNSNTSEKRKAHTGEHILFRALSTVFEGLTVKKVELGKRNYFLVHYDKELGWDSILEAEEIANRIIREGRTVKKIEGSRKEIEEQFPHLRVRWDRIKEDTVCVVEVEGFDWAACVGEHVENTAEIDYILVTRVTSVGKGVYEVEFEVAGKAKAEALRRSHIAREVAFLLRTSLKKVVPTVKNLKESNAALTESVRLLTRNLTSRLTPEEIRGISVYCEDLSGADRKFLQRTASQLTRRGKVLVLFVEQSEPGVAVAARSPSLSLDCRTLTKEVLPEGRGGGKSEYAMASFPHTVDISDVRAKIRQFLEKSEQTKEHSSPENP